MVVALMRPEIVFLDVGGTLIYPDPPVAHVYASALQDRGIAADPEDVHRQFESAWRALRTGKSLRYGPSESDARRWWRAVVRRTVQHFGEPNDFEPMFQELWEHFAAARSWKVYVDVAPTLHALTERGLSLALISNWDLRLVPVLKGLGLWERFEPRVISFQIGIEKPDVGIFRHALRSCAGTPRGAVHVGDSYEEDVLGALEAGLHAVLLRREDSGAGCAGVPVIRTLTQLVDMFT